MRFADRAALVAGSATVSFRDLDLKSDAVAFRLSALGAGFGDRIALLTPRSIDAVVAMLGILKCGAAYVPLDPSYPVAANKALLADSLPNLVVGTRELLGAHQIPGPTAVDLEDLTKAIGAGAGFDDVTVDGDAAAYIMYTSGSTGTPKGVIVPHRGIVRLTVEPDYMTVGPDDVVLHTGPLAFDASTWEIWSALLNGARLVIVEEIVPSLDALAAAVRTNRVTTLLLTTGLFHAVAEHDLSAYSSVRQFLTGGDVLSPQHASRVARALPGCRIVNAYGPTENTVITCTFDVTATQDADTSVPIGRPIRGTTAYILDDELRPVADGQIGQLATGGSGVALGYFNRDQLTAERFVRDEIGGSGKLYLTGDLARARTDGAIEFLGRADRQVKISGKRVELEEIENRLRADPRIRDAVAAVRHSGPATIIGIYLKPAVWPAAADFAECVLDDYRKTVPGVLVPSEAQVLERFPLTANGKVDRSALPPFPAARPAGDIKHHTHSSTLALVREIWSDVLGRDALPDDRNFFDLGGTSLSMVRVHAALAARLGTAPSMTQLFAYPTIARLVALIDGAADLPATIKPHAPAAVREGIAIIGMAARLPGADGIEQFWSNLMDGRASITRFRSDELEDSFDTETRSRPDFVAAKPVIEGTDLFDAAFFGFNAKDAALTDPQQRVFLECVWQAFEDAGYDPRAFAGKIGIYAGSAFNTYFLNHVMPDGNRLRAFTSDFQVGSYQELLGALPEFVATRTAYKLDLRGPAINVQSACSTSLLAVAQAVQALRAGQCDMAVAGGVSISFPQKRGYIHTEGGMVSRDGTCRPFDAAASGTIFGSGSGAVILKRVSDAERDGDHIYAVVSGVGVNNDGSGKIGFTAPSASGQADAIASALADADVPAGSVGLIEAHGTATPLGDPIEFSGLMQVFGARDADSEPCLLSSVKANVGHLDAAAGITGLIKAALALDREAVPPQIGFDTPNPALDLAGSPFRIATQATAWPRSEVTRRAGVSSFGVGGTNVHLVLEEAPAIPKSDARPSDAIEVLAVSARSDASVRDAARSLAEHLTANPNLRLRDVAATLAHGRRAFPHRIAVAAGSLPCAVAALSAAAARPSIEAATDARAVLLFPGQGAQYGGMGHALIGQDPLYADWIERGLRGLDSAIADRLRPLLTAPATDGSAEAFADTALAQPGLFIVEHALAQTLMAQGAVPTALAGHSLGEFVAAAISGVMSFDDALRIVATRGALMAALPRGAMLAVRTSEQQAQDLVVAVFGTTDGLDVAAVNTSSLVTLSGRFDAVDIMEAECERRGIAARRLQTSHAFHSSMMDDAVAPLRNAIGAVKLSAPRIPIVSTVTGTELTADQATSPDYWARHGRETVNFLSACRTLASLRPSVVVEVGPGRALSSFVRQSATADMPPIILGTLDQARAEPADGAATRSLASTLGDLWSAGVAVTIPTRADARRVSLPPTPFERKRYWIEAPAPVAGDVEAAVRRSSPAISVEPPLPSSTEITTSSSSMTSSVQVSSSELTDSIVRILEDISGETISGDAYAVPFLELGFDSLLLGQVAQRLQKTFGVKLTFRQLMAAQSTVDALVQHIAPHHKPQAAAPPTSAPQPVVIDSKTFAVQARSVPAPAPTASGSAATTDVAALMRDQLAAMQQVIAQQLAVLQHAPTIATPVASASLETAPAAKPVQSGGATVPAKAGTAIEEVEGEGRFKMYRSGGGRTDSSLTNAQSALIDEIVARTDRMSPQSKARAAASRRTLADPRSVAGFRAEWKEIIYPIVVDKAKGAYLDDIDGNRFIDLVNGYGQIAFGHSPDFAVEAMAKQLENGFAIGPQTPLAAEVADLFCELTGNERATFCVTGSEAVMAAMRVARAVTGRDKVVYFGGDYHGQFDEVLAKGLGARAKAPGAQPIAPGIPRGSVANMVVLAYDNPKSLAYIRENGDEIAAVLVETVQSRHPGLVPIEFLRELRAITEATGTALVFDEVVTGFRVHPGGMQAVLGIRADLATYGKVAGGGMPIGILAGKSRFMDALDGGAWQFGDDSVPEVPPTFFAGTFVRHPLVLAAVKATLQFIKAQGPALQAGLDRKTQSLVDRLNASAAAHGLSTRFERYSSYFYANFAAEDPLASLLFPLMRLDGVLIYEGFTCFVTTAHSDADLDRIVQAFDTALDRLQAAGILPGRGGTASAQVAGGQTMLPEAVTPTEGQREIYLAAQLGDDASIAFNESFSVTFEGLLDADALVASVKEVIGRHDALRASFGATGEHMHVAPPADMEIPLTDLSKAADPEAALAARLDADARRPFDLETGPLVRCELVKIGEERHVLVFTAHHIVCDGWSANVILEEIATLYSGRVTNRPVELPAPLQFRQFAIDSAQRPVAAETDDFWARMHRDSVPFDLPSDRPRPAQRTWRGASISSGIDATTLKGFKTAAAKQGASLFNALFSITQVLLARLSGSNDITLAVPMAGQSDLDAPSFVGHCVNFMPVRHPVDLSMPFADHLKSLGATLDDAYVHRDTTLGRIVRTMALKRDLNRTPLTDVQFNLERITKGATFHGLDARTTPNPKAAVNFDLFLNCIESADGLRIDVDYSTDLFDRATVERWIGHFKMLIASAAHDMTATAGALTILEPATESWLVDTLNATESDYDSDALVHELVERQVRKTPDAVAVVTNTATLTYDELDRAANRLANTLAARGLRPGDCVAIAVHRSADMLIALIGTLKAGCTYVPLDPTHPEARLRQTLETAKTAALLINDASLATLAGAGTTVIDLARERAAIATAPETLVRRAMPGTRTEPTAYVIFTSGSTGVPKGVSVGHRAVVNFLTSMASTPGLTKRDTMLAVTTVCFDIAVLELFLPLVCGARVVIADRGAVTDGFQLVELIERERATAVQATPSLWRILTEAGFKPRPGIKMLCGGEPLARDLADALVAGGGELWNMYGPTETTIWSSCGRVGAGSISIGAPIANTQMFILDDREQLAAPGVTGDLYIGGDGLAQGYFERDDLTSAAFKMISIGRRPTARLYRTGDVGRRMPDGSIELLGRSDQQIKLRGYRIELEDIESVLRTAPAVAQCAVGVDRADPTAPRLVAYVVPKSGERVETQALVRHLSSHLPDYMVPGAFLEIEQLPMTGNGKLDRKALSSQRGRVPSGIQSASPYAQGVGNRDAIAAEAGPEPKPGLEETIASVWREVLRISEVSSNTSLLQLGADSLHLFRIAARLQARGLRLQARDLLRQPTIAAQAALLSAAPAGEPAKSTMPSLAAYKGGARRVGGP